MPGSPSVSRPQTFNLDLSDPSLTGFASNVTGASWPLTATSVPDGLAHQVSIRNDSANDKSAIDITIVGTDADGNAQTETITGPTGSATVESTLYYKTLTSVTPASTWGADTADIGYVDEAATGVIQLNWLAEAIAAINADVTGTINYTIQQTFDDFTQSSFTAPSQQVQWLDIVASQTADVITNTVGGALGVRLLVNSYSNGAEIQLNVNPTYVANQPGVSGGADQDVNVAQYGGTATTLGQKTMASSMPVVIASDQTAVASNLTTVAGTAVVTAGVGGLPAVGGAAAHDAAISGNPVRAGVRALSANYTAVATGDVADLISTLVGALVTRPYAIPETEWSYAAASGGIVDTADVEIRAAQAAGIRNYITHIDLQNTDATVGTEVVVKDGSTVIWRQFIPASIAATTQPSPVSFEFPNPLKGSAATALNVACITTSAQVYFNATGYSAP